jgi:hypothetical protein
MVYRGPPFTSYILWYRHELTRSACKRDGRANTRMRTRLLLNATAVQQTLVPDFVALQCRLSESDVVGINPLTPELNPSAQRWLTRFFTWDFAS